MCIIYALEVKDREKNKSPELLILSPTKTIIFTVVSRKFPITDFVCGKHVPFGISEFCMQSVGRKMDHEYEMRCTNHIRE